MLFPVHEYIFITCCIVNYGRMYRVRLIQFFYTSLEFITIFVTQICCKRISSCSFLCSFNGVLCILELRPGCSHNNHMAWSVIHIPPPKGVSSCNMIFFDIIIPSRNYMRSGCTRGRRNTLRLGTF